jgi:phosphoribosylamine--glycine ligase
VHGQSIRVLLLGSGAREHAIAWKLAAEQGVAAVTVAPGSAAIAAGGRIAVEPGADPLDGRGMVELARTRRVDLVVIGPEAPLAAGVADELRAAGFATFGPGADAARIETSKAYCHEVAQAAGVRMARAKAFLEPRTAVAYARELDQAGRGIVVKADGLAGGKGVTVCDMVDEAERAIDALFARPADAHGGVRVVIEERLFGLEASLIAVCDGREALALPPARDHKRLLDGDRGPNTGGMGAYSPLPDLSDDTAEALVGAVHRPLLAELARRGTPFRGALYAGLILTPDGPALLECNARFGDPETQAILPRLAVDLGPLLLAAAEGDLAAAAARLGIGGSLLPATDDAAVAIVLAAAGYPDAPRRGDPIAGIGFAEDAGALVFHGGTAARGDGRFETAGGRILTVVGRGNDLGAARQAADAAADRIGFAGMQRRTDIAAELPAAGTPGLPGAAAAPSAVAGAGR